jgi:lipopolysaccharide/colanic/teichoic acid biosynthesis glycosyltransferase
MKRKRVFDFVLASIGLVVISPILLLIAISIKVSSGGPIFFIQKRVGKGGKLFSMIKFRTMDENHNGSSISVQGESRITPIGAFLRKYKLDELPELINVIKGDMSFVGPRPDVPGYADKLEGSDRIILSIRPGITGLASLKYKNEEEILSKVEDPVYYNDFIIFPDKVKINKNYVYNQNLLLDIKIIVATIFGIKIEKIL